MKDKKYHIPNDVRECNYWLKRKGYGDTYKVVTIRDKYYKYRYRVINLENNKILIDTPEFGWILEQLIVDEHVEIDW